MTSTEVLNLFLTLRNRMSIAPTCMKRDPRHRTECLQALKENLYIVIVELIITMKGTLGTEAIEPISALLC